MPTVGDIFRANDCGTLSTPGPCPGMACDFHEELDRLQGNLPNWISNMIAAARKPRAFWVRVPLGIALVLGGIFSILPVLGLWMLPLGLALLALDMPFLRGPLAKLLGYINDKLKLQAN